jgi:hypothetical protein
VEYIKTVENEFDTKLIRQAGMVRNLDSESKEFDLCLIEDGPQPALSEGSDDSLDCVRVNAEKASASIFDDFANPVLFGELANGDTVTVVGRFFLVTPQSISADSAGEDGIGEDGLSEDDDPEDDISEDDTSEDDASEDDTSEDDASEDDASEDDASEDDASEDDASEDDVSEDDASEDDDSDDEGSEGNSDRPKMVLVAEVIWSGSDITRSDNVACSAIAENVELGRWYQNSEFPLAEEEWCMDQTSRPTTLQPGMKIYDGEGNELQSASIVAGVFNRVDGFVSGEGESEVLRAVLVMLDLDEVGEGSSAGNQLVGIIGDMGPGSSLILITDDGDRCVIFNDEDTRFFDSSLGSDGTNVFSEVSASSLATDRRANTFGVENSEGCLAADTIILEDIEDT